MFKQQKTQLHPTLVSIIEEEETFSEEEDEGLQLNDLNEDNDNLGMDEIIEENTSYDVEDDLDESISAVSSNDIIHSVNQDELKCDSLQKSQTIQILKEGVKDDLNLLNYRKCSNVNIAPENTLKLDKSNKNSPGSISSFKSSLSQVFNEYQRKQDNNKSLRKLNKIYDNYNINTI